MADVGDAFVLLAATGQATEHGEEGVTYTLALKRGARCWMSREEGQGIAGVPEDELADTAIWAPAG
jgi:hypothetical protein